MARHIYVHIPFCEAKCPYCSFFSRRSSPDIENEYLHACMKEAAFYKERIGNGLLPDNNLKLDPTDRTDTVNFGGGTPSVPDAFLTAELLERVIDAFGIGKEDMEATIEANPHSLTLSKAKTYRNAGFNRISIGIQSLDKDVLKTLGRLHDPKAAEDAIRIARDSGFRNISADLITGVPGQTVEGLIKDAGRLLDLGVSHISLYALSVEEGTPFYSRYGDAIDDIVDPSLERKMYHDVRAYLKTRGFCPYEISNCSPKGRESIHNSIYWKGLEYAAIGAGAHGFLDSVRFCHDDDIESYIQDPVSVTVEETLDEKAKQKEYMMLMLRTSEGVADKAFTERFGREPGEVFGDGIRSLLERGLIEKDGGRIRLTSPKGLDLANEVFREFV